MLQFFQFQVFRCNKSASRLKKVKSVAWQIDEAIQDGQMGKKTSLHIVKVGKPAMDKCEEKKKRAS